MPPKLYEDKTIQDSYHKCLKTITRIKLYKLDLWKLYNAARITTHVIYWIEGTDQLHNLDRQTHIISGRINKTLSGPYMTTFGDIVILDWTHKKED